ncbi:MAG: 2-succinyl-5-enolpyruvyl-6-hydroxy-3-cyclohexene-1-carboxylic-acid synthase [Candidatus Neomarinimicrobiota bacterium]|nr:MAG: 2-succinyl-5-enolpyruvyl-6-hydroxy-3-cyclohexene-1-carboxylic-acid synthase [Candidatus Neomarinimicrobiota bacterium]
MSEPIDRCLDLAELCVRHGISQAVLSPGSRNAPLSLAFSRTAGIQTRMVLDERSAGFLALGLAQATGQPVALICTSGTAVLNYAPAVTEAYYARTPLLVLTADRPPEWIDQRDGQSIHQDRVYEPHIRFEATLPTAGSSPDERWHWNRLCNEALLRLTHPVSGPVHLNVPFREPFYPKLSGPRSRSAPRKIDWISGGRDLASVWPEVGERLRKRQRILVVGGWGEPDGERNRALARCAGIRHLPVVGDHIANLGQFPERIWAQDTLALSPRKELEPDLIITWGRGMLSRPWKTWLRQRQCPVWYLDPAGEILDTTQRLETVIGCTPTEFFRTWAGEPDAPESAPDYLDKWQAAQEKVQEFQSRILAQTQAPLQSEPWIIARLLQALSRDTVLHLGNSMPVRWANFFPLPEGVEVRSNRGTSGIDGILSTALGHAWGDPRLQILVLGDLSLAYDCAPFLNQGLPGNLHILVLNNGGGGIFGLIDGPADQPEFDTVFRQVHEQSVLDRVPLPEGGKWQTSTVAEFDRQVHQFVRADGVPRVWELQTDWQVNKRFLTQLKEVSG